MPLTAHSWFFDVFLLSSLFLLLSFNTILLPVPESSDVFLFLQGFRLKQRFPNCAPWFARDPRPVPRRSADRFL